jgi:hypothetical protein
VPPEDGRLTPETCRGLRHKVFVKVKVCQVGYVIVILGSIIAVLGALNLNGIQFYNVCVILRLLYVLKIIEK